MSSLGPVQRHQQSGTVPTVTGTIDSMSSSQLSSGDSYGGNNRYGNSVSTGQEPVSSSRSSTVEPQRDMYMTVYERAAYDLNNDKRCARDIAIGKQIGFYRLREEIGSGNFSQVKLGVHILTKEKVAVKILDKTKFDAKTQRLLSREMSSMERLHHPNIIRLYEVIETLSKLYVIMEYASNGELYTKITNDGRLPESDAKVYFAQIVAAVQHMHKRGIIHRDLKAENVLFSGSRVVKVADFGFSTPIDGSDGSGVELGPAAALTTFCGSPPYAAPELFRDDSYYGVYVDIWALGIMLYFMVSGILPFRADTVGKLKKCILDGSYSMPSYISESCRTLIRSILQLVPADRLSLVEIRSSEWLEGQDFPSPLEPFYRRRTSSSASPSADESEAFRTIAELGISEGQVESALASKQARSSITGTYRIILHRIQKRQFEPEPTPRSGRGSNDNGNGRQQNGAKDGGGGKPNAPVGNNKQSKTCAIL